MKSFWLQSRLWTGRKVHFLNTLSEIFSIAHQHSSVCTILRAWASFVKHMQVSIEDIIIFEGTLLSTLSSGFEFDFFHLFRIGITV